MSVHGAALQRIFITQKIEGGIVDDQTKHMLLMAAKAAGYKVEWHEDLKSAPGFYIESGIVSKRWNPLDDDGDALRLAVKLQLTICNEQKSCNSAYCTIVENDGNEATIGEADGDYESQDEISDADYAATRLAITRAAAHIGEAMP